MIGPLHRRASDRVVGVPSGPAFDALTSHERMAIQEQLALRYLGQVARREWDRDFARDPITKAVSRRPVAITLHGTRPHRRLIGSPASLRALTPRSA